MSEIEISYDALWKDAVENLFPDFIKLIAPDFYPHVDWSNPIEFLDKELLQISPKSEETKRFVDRLVKVWMLNGEERWVLVHVEVQGYRETEFSRRMFIYFYIFLRRESTLIHRMKPDDWRFAGLTELLW